MIKLLPFLLLIGCATTPKAEPLPLAPPPPPHILRWCPFTLLVGWAPEELLDTVEEGALRRAKEHCPELYKNSPCLVKFERKEPQTFWATCGKEITK